MALTPKQERNGIPEMVSTRETGPGPMPDCAGPMEQAETAADDHAALAMHLFDTPAGSGLAGHDMASFEWDDGLAINDVEGGMSG